MRWALAVGKLPNELLNSITVDDLVEQMAFFELEPFGFLTDERRFGQLMSLTANINRNPEVKKEPWSPEDFMPALAAERDGHERSRRVKMTAQQASEMFDAKMFGVSPDQVPTSRKPQRVQ